MIDEKWEENVFAMAKHKLMEAIEKLNRLSYQNTDDVHTYKEALKALYYLLSIEKGAK